MTQSVNDGGVCRTAPAQPGLLKIEILLQPLFELQIDEKLIPLISHSDLMTCKINSLAVSVTLRTNCGLEVDNILKGT